MSEQAWLWIGCVGMLLGAGAILALGKKRTPGEEMHTILHGLVPIVAACSYFAMATGQGAVELPLGAVPSAGRLFYWARYVDWSVTTPMLLLALSSTAMHSGARRRGAVFGLVGADVLMIATALFFGFSEVAWIKWVWFLISCVAFLGVYYVMFGPFMVENARETASVQSVYRRNAVVLSVIWLLYPIVLALCPDGLGTMSSVTGVALFAVIDLIAKVVFGLMATLSTTKLTDEELAEPGRREAGRYTTSVRPVAAE